LGGSTIKGAAACSRRAGWLKVSAHFVKVLCAM
jgi:hypothetical protein